MPQSTKLRPGHPSPSPSPTTGTATGTATATAKATVARAVAGTVAGASRRRDDPAPPRDQPAPAPQQGYLPNPSLDLRFSRQQWLVDGKCLNCAEKGHTARECPYQRRDGQPWLPHHTPIPRAQAHPSIADPPQDQPSKPPSAPQDPGDDPSLPPQPDLHMDPPALPPGQPLGHPVLAMEMPPPVPWSGAPLAHATLAVSAEAPASPAPQLPTGGLSPPS